MAVVRSHAAASKERDVSFATLFDGREKQKRVGQIRAGDDSCKIGAGRFGASDAESRGPFHRSAFSRPFRKTTQRGRTHRCSVGLEGCCSFRPLPFHIRAMLGPRTLLRTALKSGTLPLPVQPRNRVDENHVSPPLRLFPPPRSVFALSERTVTPSYSLLPTLDDLAVLASALVFCASSRVPG